MIASAHEAGDTSCKRRRLRFKASALSQGDRDHLRLGSTLSPYVWLPRGTSLVKFEASQTLRLFSESRIVLYCAVCIVACFQPRSLLSDEQAVYNMTRRRHSVHWLRTMRRRPGRADVLQPCCSVFLAWRCARRPIEGDALLFDWHCGFAFGVLCRVTVLHCIVLYKALLELGKRVALRWPASADAAEITRFGGQLEAPYCILLYLLLYSLHVDCLSTFPALASSRPSWHECCSKVHRSVRASGRAQCTSSETCGRECGVVGLVFSRSCKTGLAGNRETHARVLSETLGCGGQCEMRAHSAEMCCACLVALTVLCCVVVEMRASARWS